MKGKTYSLHAWIRVAGVNVVYPPRWKFWAKPEQICFSRWERHPVTLTQHEAEVILNADPATMSLVKKLAGKGSEALWGLQLEELDQASDYVVTTDASGKPACQAVQYGDQTVCEICDQAWDTHDENPPACRTSLLK